MKKEILQLIPQKYKGPLGAIINYMPVNRKTQKKRINFQTPINPPKLSCEENRKPMHINETKLVIRILTKKSPTVRDSTAEFTSSLRN